MRFGIFGKRAVWGCFLAAAGAVSLSNAMVAEDTGAGAARPSESRRDDAPLDQFDKAALENSPLSESIEAAASHNIELAMQEPTGGNPWTMPAGPFRGGLEEFLQQGLTRHPEIHAAQAQVELARANLASKRMQVLELLTKLWNSRTEAEIVARSAEVALQNASEMRAQARNKKEFGAIFLKELLDAEALYENARARVELAEGQLEAASRAVDATYLYFAQADPHHPPMLDVRNQKCTACHEVQQATMAGRSERVQTVDDTATIALMERERIRAELTDEMDLAAKLDQKVEVTEPMPTLGSAIAFLQSKADLNLQIRDQVDTDAPFRLKLRGVLSVGAVMQAIEDTCSVYFLKREYGVVVAAQVPPGADMIVNQWLQLRRLKKEADVAERVRVEKEKLEMQARERKKVEAEGNQELDCEE
jgi:multidrug efflux pump subunit AcrA (membrane-fusion protein)